MEIDCLPFDKTGYFSKLICDYLGERPQLRPFYGHYPHLANFEKQMAEKKAHFPKAHRTVLQQALVQQYKGLTCSKKTKNHLDKLTKENTFTVVTGHQLNLFTGPLYFLYKIISTINLCNALAAEYPQGHFVPVYWMATEDHDFEEINYFNFKGKKIQWNREAAGAVGHLGTEGLEEVLTTYANLLGDSAHAQEMKRLFKAAYLEHGTLAEATRYLANELFGDHGLVIVDGDHADLKRLLVPYAKQDILEQKAFRAVGKSIGALEALEENYPIQVNPREINYFYLKDGVRERMVQENGIFRVKDTEMQFSREALLKELEAHPERFSPNVIARPLYQEVVLPNLCYIGGGGELAYWLQLRGAFQEMEVPFPMLLLRNSALLITPKQKDKMQKLDVSLADVFLAQNSLINKKIRQISNIDIDFSPQKKALEKQFEALYALAEQTDKSFLGAVKAQETKQKNGLDHLEKRLLRAQKRKLADHVHRLAQLQDSMFPGKSLQERHLNFSEAYLEYGAELIPMLFNALNPLKQEFVVITAE
ncbi:bacillithiol biosynthesis cysteine-adding enzyme BshC [Maribacter sp. 2307ULW6-5]|uniref:bacillithiol biosynthesis cysteine-adding enzyme BshC n=1 Tax=Maribacter sp. 2307ULW6-5 TaxID=3386275 RepID=UPI0039BCEE70